MASPASIRLALVALALSCASASPAERPSAGVDVSSPDRRVGPPAPPVVELVESVPVETTLDHAQIPDTHAVWLEMIAGAHTSLAFSHFYASSAPGTRLDEVVVAVETAAARGVDVELLVDASFAKTYPATLARLSQRRGIAVRTLDLESKTGGVQHAKYFVVDDREAWLGSANFDWRALTHIHEIGVRIRAPSVARALGQLHAQEWAWAGGAPLDAAPTLPASAAAIAPGPPRIELVASPEHHVPAGIAWDLPRLVALLDGARRTIHVQLLTYATVDREGRDFRVLDEALRRAQARGIRVDLVVSDWSLGEKKIGALRALAALPGLSVRVVRIPPFSGGSIPFARVAHAKYLVVDGERAWIGTSNWEGDYFLRSRNVGLVVDDRAFAAGLERVFADVGPYCRPLDE